MPLNKETKGSEYLTRIKEGLPRYFYLFDEISPAKPYFENFPLSSPLV